MPTPAEVAVLRRANRALVGLHERRLLAVWAALDLTKPEKARDTLVTVAPQLAAVFGEASAALSADWYDEVRFTSGRPSGFRAEMAPVVPREVVEARVRFGAQHLFSGDPAQTYRFLSDALSEYVLQPGRDTIVESVARDPQASGWQRMTSPGACGFCRMLADRGGVYRAETATFAAHGSCGCVAVPSWDPNAREVAAMPYRASQRQMDDYDRARVRAYLAEHYS